MTNRTRSLIVVAALAATIVTGWHTAAHAQPRDDFDYWVTIGADGCSLDVVPSGAPLEVTVNDGPTVTIEAPQTIHVDGPATVVVGHRTPKQYDSRTYEVPACPDLTTTTTSFPPSSTTSSTLTPPPPPPPLSTTTTLPTVTSSSVAPPKNTTTTPPTSDTTTETRIPPPSVPPTTSTPTGDDSSTDCGDGYAVNEDGVCILVVTGPSDLTIIATIGAIITAVGYGMTRIGKGDA